MHIAVRPIVESDFERLIVLFQELAQFEQLPEKMTNTVARMRSEQEYFHGFVACNEGDELLGYVSYFFAYYTWTGKCLYMDDLYVRQAYRGKGIGKQLLQTVIEYGKGQQCHKLRWQVSSWNTHAQDFYKSIGAAIDSVEWNCDLKLQADNSLAQ